MNKSERNKTLIVLAHGAGLGSSAPWMTAWAERLESLGAVVPFDYPYMAAGRKSPDRLPKLIAAHAEALAGARQRYRQRKRVLLIGKSMGSRVGCHLSLEQPVSGLVCLGYPLVGAGKNKTPRSEVLEQLTAPVLFVQGTRDRLCPLDLLEDVRQGMSAKSQVFVVEGGDHSLLLGKKRQKETGISQGDSDAAALAEIERFVGKLKPLP